jgi:hypothetical protein
MPEYTLPKSKRGAHRQYNAIVNRWYRQLKGGTEYGIDWPTARIFFPTDCAHIDQIRAVYKSLPT